MKKSVETDIVCIERVLKYVNLIGEAYTSFNVVNSDNLRRNHVCQLAISQAITNIHELRKKMRIETVKKCPCLKRKVYA